MLKWNWVEHPDDTAELDKIEASVNRLILEPEDFDRHTGDIKDKTIFSFSGIDSIRDAMVLIKGHFATMCLTKKEVLMLDGDDKPIIRTCYYEHDVDVAKVDGCMYALVGLKCVGYLDVVNPWGEM